MLYDRSLYRSKSDQIVLPVLLPSLLYHFDPRVHCLNPEAGNDSIKFLLHDTTSPVPLLSAMVKMPLSELAEDV